MRELISLFAAIMRGRAGPQDVPDSSFLLRTTAAVYMISTALLYAGRTPSLVAALVALDIVLLVLWVWIVLSVRRRLHRARQTLIALLGTGVLFALIQLALKLMLGLIEPGSDLALLPGLGFFVVAVWLTVVNAHIMRLAIDASMVVGVAVALAYTFVVLAASSALLRSFGSEF